MITMTQITDSTADLKADYEIEMPYDLRKKSRVKVQARCGETLGLILPRGHILRNGTRIKNESGQVAVVLAANESVSTATSTDSLVLTKAAYHLGNRHVPLQVGDGWLRYQHDHVLDEMVKGLGLTVIQELNEFEPEDGAYSAGITGGHHHH